MSERNLRDGIRSAVRGLWSGAISSSQFEDAMQSTIRRNLTKAWLEGAKECGISQEDLTEQEIEARDSFISGQFEYISGFAEAIEENSKENEGRLEPLYQRADKWVDRYSEAKANGHAMACADEKSEFVYGDTIQHCTTCIGLRGRVYRNSVWIKYNAVPPHNWNFACRGGCRCRLRSTDKPITRGRFPIGLLR